MTTGTATAKTLAFTIDAFAASTGIGRTSLYDAIKNRQLRAKKCGKRTIILAEDGRAFLDNLPELNTGRAG